LTSTTRSHSSSVTSSNEDIVTTPAASVAFGADDEQERRSRRLLLVSMKEGGLSMALAVWGYGPRVGWWCRAVLMSLSPRPSRGLG
jgi:hypothetical protein